MKKIIYILLGLILVFAFSSCGKSETSGITNTSIKTSTTVSTTDVTFKYSSWNQYMTMNFDELKSFSEKSGCLVAEFNAVSDYTEFMESAAAVGQTNMSAPAFGLDQMTTISLSVPGDFVLLITQMGSNSPTYNLTISENSSNKDTIQTAYDSTIGTLK